MIPLQVPAMNYQWGKLGDKSSVADLLVSSSSLNDLDSVDDISNSNSKKLNISVVDKTKRYAELWMGTHPVSVLINLNNLFFLLFIYIYIFFIYLK